MSTTQAQIEAALEESELSNMICGVAHCRCVGDENGADPDTAFCFNVARLVRQHVLSLLAAAAEVGDVEWARENLRQVRQQACGYDLLTIERCAQVAEQHWIPGPYNTIPQDIADAIRKLKEEHS